MKGVFSLCALTSLIRNIQSLVAEFYPHKLVLSLSFESTLEVSLLSNPNLSKKATPLALMAPKMQTVVYNDVPSKGRTNNNAGGHDPPHAADRERTTDDVNSSYQGTTTSAQPPLYESQIL